jgi:hypothetical protein
MRTHDSNCTGPEVLQVMAVATILLQYETCAQNHVIVGSQKRKRSDAHSIDELLSAVYNTDGGVGNAIVTAATVDLPSHVDTR